MSAPRVIKVFIASPGDLAVERRAFKDVIDELNEGYGLGAKVKFQPLAWEDALAQAGKRSQSIINRDVDACDVFVLAMWRRWGQPAPDAVPPHTSYTEEEYDRAWSRYQSTRSPTIFVFFKHIDPGQMVDPGEQLSKVLAFRRKLESTRSVLYRGFADETQFRKEIRRHLVAFADGMCNEDAAACTIPIDLDAIARERDKYKAEAVRAVQELEKLKAEASRALAEAEQARAQAKNATARAEAAESVAEATAAARSVALAQDAARAALQGKIEEARQTFAQALDGTTNLQVLGFGSAFFERIGELEEAERLLRRSLAISGPDAVRAETAVAYGNLGNVLKTRGHLDQAEKMYRRSLEIDEKLARHEGLASDYGSLGLVMRTRGHMEGAESMLRKALEIDERLGRREGIASHCGSLGLLMEAKGDLEGAEAMLRRSLAINETLDRPEGVASDYGSLGLVRRRRGDLPGAEAMLRKALAIDEKLGRLEGVASHCGSLGLVLRSGGDLATAEEMLRKALAIDEKLGRLEGTASHYSNLGDVMRARGREHDAKEMWTKSRDLYARLGAHANAIRAQSWIDGAAFM